jgi:hypothetical protein
MRIESELKRGTSDEFQAVLDYLEKIPDINDRIEHLVNIKTKWEQNTFSPIETTTGEKTFGQKCQLEIDKLRQFAELEARSVPDSYRANHSCDPETGGDADDVENGVIREANGERKLTKDRAILLIYSLGSSRLKGLDQKKISHLIAYLIENKGGAGQIEKRFSEIFPSKKPDDEGKIKKAGSAAWEQDIETVCYYLDLVGLPDESAKLKKLSLYE